MIMVMPSSWWAVSVSVVENERKRNTLSTSKFTFVDLFAGVGGFHAALSAMGGECLLAVEKDEEAARVYEDNWGMDPRGDVSIEAWMDQLELQPGALDVLAGGFPCQPFSKSGAQRGMDEARGTLFFRVCEAIERWKPAVVVLENVRNLTGPRHAHEWEVVTRSLYELGYEVSATPAILSPHRLAPSAGGTPQARDRVYILATRCDDPGKLRAPGQVEQTIQLTPWGGTWDLAEDLPLEEEVPQEEAETLQPSAQEAEWFHAWGELVARCRSIELELPRFPIWVDAWKEQTPGAPAWKETIELKNRSFYLANRELLDAWLEEFEVETFPGSRRKLEWQAQDAESLKDCLVQMRPSGLRAKKKTHAGALVAIDQRPFIVSESRRLSVRECARLQGFPEEFTFRSVPHRAAYKQLGNAVHVGSVTYALTTHLEHERTRELLTGHRLLAL